MIVYKSMIATSMEERRQAHANGTSHNRKSLIMAGVSLVVVAGSLLFA